MATKRMLKAAEVGEMPAAAAPPVPRPRLHKLKISNFRSIGPVPVEIELDDIVVLVGPNNAGKSSILRAYKVAMEHGSSDGELTQDDFPNSTLEIDDNQFPMIELETVVYDKTAPGDKWVRTDPITNEMFVREKWTWAAPGKPKKVGWDVAANAWHVNEGPWGAPNVAQAYRPKPHYVTAFDKPEEQATKIVDLLKEAINSRVKEAKKPTPGASGEAEASEYEKFLESIKVLQKSIAADAVSAVENIRTDLGKMISEVFPGYCVTFDPRPEDDIEKNISFFKAGAQLKMGPRDGIQTTLDRQGSGACRTLLWTALRILSDRPTGKGGNERPNLLLMDEPELCLHPDAIRESRRVLYDLPTTTNWQVMITTHSPVFVDFSRDNTSIVRVERCANGVVQGTTIYRPERAKLDEDDRLELKLLNLCDPYVAEFFFGGRTIIVEGDTEYTAFKHVIGENPSAYKGVHIVRARGKACVTSLCKILNQFGTGYAVLHDSDREMVISKKTGKEHTNSAWTENSKILTVTEQGRAAGKIRLIASVPNLEAAFFGEEADGEKPYGALSHLKADNTVFQRIASLLDALMDTTKAVPNGAKEWASLDDLAQAVHTFDQQ